MLNLMGTVGKVFQTQSKSNVGSLVQASEKARQFQNKQFSLANRVILISSYASCSSVECDLENLLFSDFLMQFLVKKTL